MTLKVPFYFSDLALLITEDEAKLKAEDQYQTIRSEINRKFTPLSGRIDWDKVATLVLKLGQQQGLDLLLSAYFCIAKTKQQGLAGLTCGLEVLSFTFNSRWDSWSLPLDKRVDLINWTIAQCVDDVKGMTVDANLLRELYRCERALSDLAQAFEQSPELKMPHLDSLGYLIFEHIDRLEKPVVKAKQTTQVVTKKVVRWGWLKLGIGLVGGFLLTLPAAVPFYTTPTVQDWLAPWQRVPTLLGKADTKLVIASFSERDLAANKANITRLYQQKITQLMALDTHSTQLEAEQLASSLAYLFPEDPSLKLQHQEIKAEQIKQLDQLNKLHQRFAASRTVMANLEQKSQQLKAVPAAIKQDIKQLHRYAISLSPILARAYYLDELLERGETNKAEQELVELETYLSGLQLKASLAKQTLQLQQGIDAKEHASASNFLPSEQVIAQSEQ
ncbi:type VI secretion system ImpA family N-terminal domain-containing protein [Motilimonas sp. E26]|uniref:type VI secretion system ImpA family N-terminal domain-containing protein n=1 Tax=Motilimonas sp. E26 TaxID=2865674 RepID=UPI001E54E52D|nr:type VI secretion system ImpA family N-terminal domain-containing protein [Motilimonas sp. E26]MCE0559229.1 type VI secretion system ImpA family N-terminal domain-containing protein [Motilimonas sp. E26]